MNKFVNWILGFILVVMSIMVCWLSVDLRKTTKELVEVYNTEPEIVFLESVEYDSIYFNHFDTVKLETIKKDTITKLDSIFISDSVEVFIPISTYHYDTTLAQTHISLICEGFDVRLNSLLIENFLNVPTQEKAPKKWYENIHLGGGLSVTYIDKFRLVPTIGIYYKLL